MSGGDYLLMRYLLLILALLLFFAWLAFVVLLHIAGALIHLILVLALVLFVVHLFSERRRRV